MLSLCKRAFFVFGVKVFDGGDVVALETIGVNSVAVFTWGDDAVGVLHRPG